MTTGTMPRAAFRRVVAGLVEAEITRQRGAPQKGALDRSGLELDSLERLGVVASLHETFDLPAETFATAYPDTLDDWVDAVEMRAPSRLFVRTSGSTGAPQRHGHDIADLLVEAQHFAGQVARCRRVVAMVPVTHLYGIVWTALLPALLDVPVVEGAGGVLPALLPHDLIVAVPDQWAALSRLGRDWPSGVTGVSSGGPLPEAQAYAALDAGVSRMIEVYGATETSGIATRQNPSEAYDLLPHWGVAKGNGTPCLLSRHGRQVDFPDRVAFAGDRRFRPVGRRDGAVQVGGRNVYPQRVAALLQSLPKVKDASVRLGTNGRLKAFVAIDRTDDPVKIEAELRGIFRARLTPAERPMRLTFGTALPRNAMGKEADWAEERSDDAHIA
ncbi:AMP-binding protein [Palleronia sp. LCG004]|uniref:AMP-binding protein n=1 Tax=Palleronia sp. LCG004 TaxID=3079304 RepID=UPI002941F7F3|nr:AMP-binding protein [Palleronia sp. LCG004]WOI55894.1 AMP-binding protein [Palleronia sp. LCG004]